MKQITNKEYEEWQKYKAEKAKGHVLLPDTVRAMCCCRIPSGSSARPTAMTLRRSVSTSLKSCRILQSTRRDCPCESS